MDKSNNAPLAGVRILDMSRLAPGPYATMLLADLGAEVITIGGGRSSTAIECFMRGKHRIGLDLKTPEGRAALHALVATADAFVEGFRPGVAAKLQADWESLRAINPRLVYCSLTGYGQDGPRAKDAGHDINYLALSGALAMMGEPDRPPRAPLNLVADFAGGSMVAAFGILAAILGARATGAGRHLDVAMIDGCLSLLAMHLPLWNSEHMPARGSGLLAGDTPFYRTYLCRDGGHVAVGALEPQFFRSLWQKLELGAVPDHMARANWTMIETMLEQAFLTRTRDEWSSFFLGSDACVTPVLTPDDALKDPHMAHRHPALAAKDVPIVPRMSGGVDAACAHHPDDETRAILGALDLAPDIIDKAHSPLDLSGEGAGMEWPPHLR